MSKSKNHVNYQFPSDSLDGLLRNGLFVSRHGYWTELSGPLLPTALTLVHFYLQVWHLPIFTHRSDTSPLLPTGLTLEGERQKISGFCHFYSRNLCSRNSRSRDWNSQTAVDRCPLLPTGWYWSWVRNVSFSWSLKTLRLQGWSTVITHTIDEFSE